MKLYELLTEMIPLSKVMTYRRAWPPAIQARYDEIFKHYANDDKGFRIYFPMTQSKPQPIKAPIDIVNALAAKGYEVLDYVKGLAIDIQTKKRQMKIGKIIKGAPDTLKKFMNDKRRSTTKKEYMTVISRHPLDIAGMSTGRGWSSCMDLVGGEYKRYVMSDVKKGTIIAYLVTIDDPDIKNPVARILIKPFLNTKNQKGTGKIIDFILVREGSTYGSGNKQFKKIIDKWLKEINGDKESGLYCFPASLYADNMGTSPKEIFSKDDEKLYAAIIKDPKLLQTTKLQFNQLLELLKRKPILVRKLKPDAQDKVLAHTGSLIDKLQQPTMAQVIIAAQTYDDALRKIRWDEMPDKEIIKLIKSYAKSGKNIIKYITNPNRAVILEMILSDRYSGEWLNDGWNPQNIEIALKILKVEDWKKIIDKFPGQVGWFIPGYMDYAENLISKSEKEKLVNYVFDKLDSNGLKNLFMELTDEWEIEFPDKMLDKIFYTRPGLIKVYDSWSKAKLSDRTLNKITSYLLALKPNKIKKLLILASDDDETIPTKVFSKIISKFPRLFFEFDWENDEWGDDYNMISGGISKPLTNKLIKYALEKMSAYKIDQHYQTWKFLKNNISDSQWRKLLIKSSNLGESIMDIVSADLQIWILKNNPQFIRSINEYEADKKTVKWINANQKRFEKYSNYWEWDD